MTRNSLEKERVPTVQLGVKRRRNHEIATTTPVRGRANPSPEPGAQSL
jgi:hypothetical protein